MYESLSDIPFQSPGRFASHIIRWWWHSRRLLSPRKVVMGVCHDMDTQQTHNTVEKQITPKGKRCEGPIMWGD